MSRELERRVEKLERETAPAADRIDIYRVFLGPDHDGTGESLRVYRGSTGQLAERGKQ